MEYKQERYTLNKFCEFRDRDVESDFMEYEKTSNLIIVRLLTLVMGVIFAIFAVSDYYFHGEESGFPLSLGLRGAALVIIVAVFFMADKFKRYSHTLLMITITELVVFAIFLLNLYNLGTHDPALHFMSVMLFILTVFLIPNLWKNSLIAACIIWAGYIIFCTLLNDAAESPSLFQRGIYLAICLVSCAIFIYGRESSERKHFAAEQLLEFISITDRLTGIYNRSRFEHVLGLWIKNMRHEPFCLVFFDIDNFKSVNDNFGHNAGDQVLIETTAKVSASIRDEDIFARWGGEEFVILFSRVNIEIAAELAERLRKAVEAHICGEVGNITISIGVVQYRRGETILDLVNRADGKMYEAKQAGKNQVVAESICIKETIDRILIRNVLEGRIFEHTVIPAKDISFSPELLKACEKNVCGKYNKCWTCPPAIGPMEIQKERIFSFSHAFVFTTKTDLEDSFDYEGMMRAKEYHDKITREMHDRFGKTNPVYGAGGCKICEICAYPLACRFPDKIFPSIEAAGINVTELSRTGGVHYNNGENTVTYFSMILFNE